MSSSSARRLAHQSTELTGTAPSLHVVPESLVAPPDTAYTRWGKRMFDVVAGSALLLVAAVPMLLAGLTIWLTSQGEVLFVQERVGRNRRSFRCLKFRTMVRNADIILLENPQLRDAMVVSWKIPNDPRVTGIGRMLRQTSMDELPQLFNVVRGEMSLVGPRPYMPQELNDVFGRHALGITTVRPGMTGLWQVSGRSNLTPADRIALDETYVAGCNFRSDLMLLGKTMRVVFSRDGAY